MDCRLLTGNRIDLADYRLGPPQHAGLLTVVPITSQRPSDRFLPLPPSRPTAGRARAAAVLTNDSAHACLLAPLHAGLPVDRGSSHILFGTTLIPPGKALALSPEFAFSGRSSRRMRFDPAKIYFLPLSLRGHAWRSRRSSDKARLQSELYDLQCRTFRHGLGSLPVAMQGRSPELSRLRGRIELLTGQTGALFFLKDRPVGLEIAPSPACFAAVWQPLLLGCYGLTAVLQAHEEVSAAPPPEPYAVTQFSDLRPEMFRVRRRHQERLEASVAASAEGEFTVEEEQRWGNYRVRSLTGTGFAGQYVEEEAKDEAEAVGGGTMPRLLHNLLRKGSVPIAEPTRHRVHYVSVFAL